MNADCVFCIQIKNKYQKLKIKSFNYLQDYRS